VTLTRRQRIATIGTTSEDANDDERNEYAPEHGSASRQVVRGRRRSRRGMDPGVALRTG